MNVEAINIGPSDAIAPVQAASALAGKGLQGDRHFYREGAAPGEALTLIEAEVLESVGLTRRPVPPASGGPRRAAQRPGRQALSGR